LIGDAANSEVLNHVGLDHARALVVTLPDEAATEMVVSAARELAPDLPIIAAATQSGVRRLTEIGAQDVIHPELEGGLEVVRHTLLALDFPAAQVQHYTDAVRHDQYDTTVSSVAERQSLDQLRNAVRGIEIGWRQIQLGSPLIRQTLAETNLRAQTGASIVAIIRAGQTLPNPKSDTRFQANDLLGLIGDTGQLAAVDQLLARPANSAAVLAEPHVDGSAQVGTML
jgi:CPA2 family monovalent cation:H+ antiporter-2